MTQIKKLRRAGPTSAAVRGAALAALCALAGAASANTPIPTTGPVEVAPRAPASARGVPSDDPRGVMFDLTVLNAPVKNVLQQIASSTGWNLVAPSDLTGEVTLTLRRVTVPVALEALKTLYGYDYRIDGTSVFFSSTAVQTRVYRVHYLPGRREGASELRVNSSSITPQNNANAANGSGNSGSSSSPSSAQQRDSSEVRMRSDSDFWGGLLASLQSLLGLDEPPPGVAQSLPQGASYGAAGMQAQMLAQASRAPGIAAPGAPGPIAGQGNGSASGSGAAVRERRSVSVNQASGLVIVRASPAEQESVRAYLEAMHLAVARQVMLEAKIIEVTLSNDAQTGINWAGFGRLPGTRGQLTIGSAAPGTKLGTTGALTTPDQTSIVPGAELLAGALGRGFYGLAFQAANFATLLNFLQSQGDVQVLSSPRIATLNNQKAVLKVGADELFVTGVSTTTTNSATGSVTTPSVQLQPFFSGISLDVTPQIDDEGNVMLHVHPTISSVAEKSKVIDLGALGSLKLPLASSSINETDSIVRVADGQIVAIGGLMRHLYLDEKTGLPVLQDLPVVGGAFRQSNSVSSKRELVILLKPTVITKDGAWPNQASADIAATPGSVLPVKQR